MPNDTRKIEIPEHTVSRIESRLSKSEFNSASEYITFVLEEVTKSVSEGQSEEDKGEIQERLRSLGYMDE